MDFNASLFGHRFVFWAIDLYVDLVFMGLVTLKYCFFGGRGEETEFMEVEEG